MYNISLIVIENNKRELAQLVIQTNVQWSNKLYIHELLEFWLPPSTFVVLMFLACCLLRFSSIDWIVCIGLGSIGGVSGCIDEVSRLILFIFSSQYSDTSPIRVSEAYRGIGVSDTYPIPVRHLGEVSVQRGLHCSH